jgi:UDP-N-acetylglucosamine 2-epimerase
MNKTPKVRLITVVGNRPQFIKMAPVSRELERRGLNQFVIHTGQHYDHDMNQIFFDELSIRPPDLQLTVNHVTHGGMTGELLEKIETALISLRPTGVLVYGDTNSTLAAALAAVKLGIPVAHVESGPRLGNLDTPEEVNRIVTDHVSTLRFAPDNHSVNNLLKEGISNGVINTGDVMYDVFLGCKETFKAESRINRQRARVFMTLHRPQNVDNMASHHLLIDFIKNCEADIIFPAHPRTKNRIESLGLLGDYRSIKNLTLMSPLSYLGTIRELINSDFVITDSGGVQKEAYFAGKLAMLMLPISPWPELQKEGWLSLAGWIEDAMMADVFRAMTLRETPQNRPDFFGDGHASVAIVDELVKNKFFGETNE